jgi:predicted molibdopterin-dependent oxidoreductase YjgC
MVEILNDNNWEARHACLLKVKEGLQIKTDTLGLRLLRSWAAKILLRHKPILNIETEKLLLSLVKDKTNEKQEDENLVKRIKDLSGTMTEGCILCGLCVRMCSKIGKHRLTYLGIGKNMRISFVPGEDGKATCGNCWACRHVCPTGFINPDAERAFTAKLY